MPDTPKSTEIKKGMETRSREGEIRSVGDDGTFEGYLTVWGVTDDYNSQFQKGAFKKTIQERSSKVKIFYDHAHLVGSSLELREDDHGLFGKGKLNLSVDKAQEAFTFMKDGTLEGLSFGFRTIKDQWIDGIRQIKEAQLYEYGPVVFPASEAALITDVRSQEFSETLSEDELRRKRWVLRDALDTTLDDIWWAEDTDSGNIVGKMDKAISEYHGAYLEFVTKWVGKFWVDSESRKSPIGNALSQAMMAHQQESRKSIVDLAADTNFTVAELTELRKGNLVENRDSLASLSDGIAAAHREIRNTAVESLCSELRGSFSDSEKQRVLALLKPVEVRQSEPTENTEIISDMLDYYKEQTGEQ
ncbi:HK97 family phage prohead protease [bacterium]|nr:HK97 family phage prohead protease [bacterium]